MIRVHRASWVGTLALLTPLILGLAQPLGLLAGDDSPATLQATTPNDDYGIAHISYGNGNFTQTRYDHAKMAGVGWNRFAFYWNEIESTPGVFDFASEDAAVNADRLNGFKTLGILFGTPNYASPAVTTQLAGAVPAPEPRIGQKRYPEDEHARLAAATGPSTTVYPPNGLNEPVFSDGTDTPGPGKTINDKNPWARFVFTTATRFKGRVTAWEIWNEPDFAPGPNTGWFGFWNGTMDQYVRLLKVAYLSIKFADPNATIVLGGMAFWFDQGFFPRFLQTVRRDPNAAASNHYFEVTSWHWYSRASFLYERSLWVRGELAKAGMDKRIWITEAQLPVCGDLAVPVRINCSVGSNRGPLDQQAAYVIQALAYARAAGVERVFIFQLRDDELGPGEYYGLVRNSGAPRPALAALGVATNYFRNVTQAYRTLSNNGKIELITMVRSDGSRVRAMWNPTDSPSNAAIPIEGTTPQLIDQNGTLSNLSTPDGSLYLSLLPTATLNNDPAGPDYIVGGKPYIITESNYQHSPGTVGGMTRDAAGRALAGVVVQVGEQTVVSDSQGRYSASVQPGLYDVGISVRSPFPGTTVTTLSGVVWSGGSLPKDFTVRAAHQRFFPLLPRQLQSASP